MSNLLDVEFKNTGYKDAQETQLGPQQHKKDPVRNEGILIEIKNNLQGKNNRVNEAKNQISYLEYKEAKTKKQNKTTQSVEQKEKRIQKIESKKMETYLKK